MSGIVGILQRDGAAVSAQDLEAALAALAPRGPDGSRCWCSGPLALGCAQNRSTAPSPHETLPLADPGRGLALVHDARLDDRARLAGELGLPAAALAAAGDGELILAAWERWGERCGERLLGDFVFALWDERERRLFLARDPIGVRSLFWFVSPRQVAFASEIKALLALPGVPRRLDPERVADFMAGFAANRAATFFAGLHRLSAGTAVVITAGDVRTIRYGEIVLPERTHPGSAADVAAGFREVLAAAVRDRVQAARPVAAMLSGGLDSSAIVCLARENGRAGGAPPLPVFSFLFPRTPASDEAAFIAAVAEQGGVVPHFIDCDATSPLDRVDELLAANDEPYDVPNLSYRWAVAALAAERGIGVVLEGNGGDGVVARGLYFLTELARRGRLLRLARELRALAAVQGLPVRPVLSKYVLQPNVPAPLRRLRRALLRRTARFPAPPFVAAELAERTRLHDRFEEFWHREQPPRSEREHHLREVGDHLPGSAFELTYGRFAVEPRFPFCDRRVIDYCLAVPPEHRIENGMTRMLTRRALAGLLPEAVRTRTRKAHPAASLVRRLFTADLTLVDETLAFPLDPALGHYLDLPALRASRERLAEWSRGHPGHPPARSVFLEAVQLFKAVVLARWLQSTRILE